MEQGWLESWEGMQSPDVGEHHLFRCEEGSTGVLTRPVMLWTSSAEVSVRSISCQ